jgi:hypothetical protein
VLAAFLGIDHVSDTAVTALATLAGVVVGAVVGGWVNYRLERRREKSQGRAGARLVRMDLALGADQLTRAYEEAAWWPFYDVTMEAWERYRDVIAIALGADDWVTVSQSAVEMQRLDTGMRTSPLAGQPRVLNADSAPQLAEIRGNAIKAFNALSKLADDAEKLPRDLPAVFGSKSHPLPPPMPP